MFTIAIRESSPELAENGGRRCQPSSCEDLLSHKLAITPPKSSDRLVFVYFNHLPPTPVPSLHAGISLKGPDAASDIPIPQTRVKGRLKYPVKNEDRTQWSDDSHNDTLHEAGTSYPARINLAGGRAHMYSNKPTIPPSSPRTDRNTLAGLAALRPKELGVPVMSPHPAHQKPAHIKKEELSNESEPSNGGNDPDTDKECRRLLLYYRPPSDRRPRNHDRILGQIPPFSSFSREPSQVDRRGLPELLSAYFSSLSTSRVSSAPLFRQLIPKFAAKTKACSNTPGGGSNAPSGFQPGSGTPFEFGGPSNQDFTLEDGSDIWSGQGPGSQLNLQDPQTKLERLLLVSLANKYGQDLVPRRRDPVYNPSVESVDLPPVPPVPLPPNLPPLPSHSAPLLGECSNLNFVAHWPPAGQPPYSTFGNYERYEGIGASSSLVHPPPTSYQPWNEGYNIPSLPLPPSESFTDLDLAGQGLDYGSHDASWPNSSYNNSGDLSDFESVLAYLNEPSNSVAAPGSSSYRIDQDFTQASNNTQQPPIPVATPDGISVPSTATGSHVPHISVNPPIEQGSGAASQFGPRRAVRSVTCQLEGCGKTFRRPHLLKDHVNLAHRGNRADYSRYTDNSNLDDTTRQKLSSRLPISNVRTVLGSPIKPVADITRQTSLTLDDHTAPPPSYDSLFAFAPANGTSKEVIKVHSPPSASKDALRPLPNEVHHVASSQDQPLPSKVDSAEGTPATSCFKTPHECDSSVMLNLKPEELQGSGSEGYTSLEALGDHNAISTRNTLGDFLVPFNILFKRALTLKRPPSLLKSLMGDSFERRPLPTWNPYSLSKPFRIKGHVFPTCSSPAPVTPVVSRRLRTSLRWTVIKAQASNSPFDDNGPSGNFSLENGGQLWSGQGPGHGSLDVESSKVWSDKYARLQSLAQELGFRLIPTQHFDLIRASLGQLFDLAPQSPVPLQGCSPPGNSSALPLADIGSNFNSVSPALPAPNGIARSTFDGHENTRNPTSSVYPLTVSCNPQTQQVHTTAPAPLSPVIPGDLSWDWLDGLGDQPTAIPQPPSDISSLVAIPTAPGLPDTTQEQFLNEFSLIHNDASENYMNQLPSTTTSVVLGTVDSPTGNYNTAVRTVETSRVGATRTTKRTPCPVENCTKSFRRPYLLHAHLSSCHEGKKAFPCTFQGCNKAYSLKTNMQRHCRSTHQRLDNLSTAGFGV
ncbi:hypothetical protein FRC09_015169 [Ceratobasidium sp. 395]|nr:hypothetical protein FRC09_015169 [Ceratobasidium sp. 395]